MRLQVRRWLPTRKLVAVADNAYAVIELLWRLIQLPNPVYMVTRLRLDAAPYEPAPPREPGKRGRSRLKDKRLPTLKQVLQDSEVVGLCDRPYHRCTSTQRINQRLS
jgi:hypothetical protein